MSHQPLSEKSASDAAKDIVAGAAVTYWLGKASSNDARHVDLEDKGRIVPTVKVRNTAEYGAVAAGQITVGHFLFPIFFYVFVFPAFVLAFWGWMAPVEVIYLITHSNAVGIVLYVLVAFLWTYWVIWRWLIKKYIVGGFKKIVKHVPKISYADGYEGPLGIGNSRGGLPPQPTTPANGPRREPRIG